MRTTIVLTATLFLTAVFGGRAAAQELTPQERTAAVARARAMAQCIEQNHQQMQRLMRLLGQSESQRRTATDTPARNDADAAIEALVTRMSDVQRDARACLAGSALPTTGTTIVERAPPADAAADSIAGSGGSIHTVESDARMSDHVHVVSGQQVDGQGRLDPSIVRHAVRRASHRFDVCYERYLSRGSAQARSLDLVFRFRGSASASRISVENSGFSDSTFERCVRTAASHIRASHAPHGEAVYSYRLRFGRVP